MTVRVLQIIGTMNRGGAETLLMEVYRHIDTEKLQFDFLIFDHGKSRGCFEDEIEHLGGRIFHSSEKLYPNPNRYLRFARAFFEHHPEYQIVHSHLNRTAGFALSQAKKSGVRCVIAHSHCAGDKTDPLRALLYVEGKRRVMKSADYYFGCSETAVESLFGNRPDGDRFRLLRNATDVQRYAFDKGVKNLIRNENGLDTSSLVLGYVARFTEEKNHEKVLEVFSTITQRNDDVRLVLVGDGPRIGEMKRYAHSLGVAENVLFLGVRDDVNRVLSALDVFIMPSKGEGLGIVLIEAQANGLPCVISADVIPEEADVRAGLVTRVGLDKPASVWADAVMSVAGKRLQPELAQEAVKKAGYDINEVAAELQEFYLAHA